MLVSSVRFRPLALFMQNETPQVACELAWGVLLTKYCLIKEQNVDENGDMSELLACTSAPVDPGGFNPHVILPYGCTIEHIQQTMSEFIDFLSFLNQQLYTKGIKRIESMLMPANFSGMVCEFIISTLPKHCSGIAKNQYPDGHPNLVPGNLFANDSVQHAEEGIEIMGSRYPGGWQGQNPGNTWLMVFVF